MKEWIPVTERLPEDSKSVLTSDGKHQNICSYTKGHEIEYEDYDYDGEYDPVEEQAGCLYLKPGWYECEETTSGEFDEVWVERLVTHWMPLPPMPDEAIEELKPVQVGILTKQQGLNNYKVAEVGHPVYEFKDRYIIYLESENGLPKLSVPYYKETLKPVIQFL